MLRNQNGLTLIELVVTAAVVGLLVLVVTNTFIAVAALQRKSRHLTIATEAGERIIESLRNENYVSIDVTNPPSGNASDPPPHDHTADLPAELPEPKSAIVEVEEPVGGLKKLKVTIQYGSGNNFQEINLYTQIANVGISR